MVVDGRDVLRAGNVDERDVCAAVAGSATPTAASAATAATPQSSRPPISGRSTKRGWTTRRVACRGVLNASYSGCIRRQELHAMRGATR